MSCRLVSRRPRELLVLFTLTVLQVNIAVPVWSVSTSFLSPVKQNRVDFDCHANEIGITEQLLGLCVSDMIIVINNLTLVQPVIILKIMRIKVIVD